MTIHRQLGCHLATVDPSAGWRGDAGGLPEVEHRIGGTSAVSMLGIAPESWESASLWGMWSDAHGERVPADFDTSVLVRGRVCEPALLELYAHRTGAKVRPMGGTVIVDPDYPWMVGSLDAVVKRDEVGGGEVKSDGRFDARDHWGEDGTVIHLWSEDAAYLLPPYYAVQTYWYMGIARNIPWFDFIVGLRGHRADDLMMSTVATVLGAQSRATANRMLDEWYASRHSAAPAVDLRVIRLMRDDETIARIREHVTELRQRHLIDGEEPPIDGGADCSNELRARFANRGKRVRRATPEEADAVRAYADARRRIRKAEHDRRMAANLLQKMIGEDRGVVLDAPPGRPAPRFTFTKAGDPKLTGL